MNAAGLSVEDMAIGGVDELAAVRNLKLNATTDCRFGTQLLYPRPLPAGFLRSSGVPVLLSSQITAAEQRLLDHLVKFMHHDLDTQIICRVYTKPMQELKRKKFWHVTPMSLVRPSTLQSL